MTALIGAGKWGVWFGGFDAHPATTLRSTAQELERAGWGCLWIPESSGRDAMVTAAILLEATSQLTVATGIAQIQARHPLTTVAAQQTLAEASGGRFLLGLGVSHAPLVTGARSLPYDKPLATMTAYLEAMEQAPYRGPRPAAPSPLVLAALGPRMVELAASHADGAHPYLVTPDHTASAREMLGPGPLLAPEQTVVIDGDARHARDLARRWLSTYLGLPNYARNIVRMGFGESDLSGPSDRLVDALVAHGDVETVAARCRAHLEAGADHVAIQVLADADRTTIPAEAWSALATTLDLDT
ncbi:MAG: TIGR03620 family F420-dependent LLM class oxidoreductase [Acidimicrobiales bacterium]